MSAQRAKPAVYFFTAASERYFSDGEIDSIFYQTCSSQFESNRIPSALFEKKYPFLKNKLIVASRAKILQSFKWVESTGGSGINSPKGSAKFEENKKLYKRYLIENINFTLLNSKEFRQYFSFDGSDRITYFNSTVRIGTNGKLVVQEIISIYNGNGKASAVYGNDPALKESGAINNEIKRGIVRAFPLYYVNNYHLFQNTTFEIKEVLKNGVRENYHTEKKDNGVLLFTGSSNVFLESGNYIYSITYETDHQIKLLKDYDELAWNATGNSWSFRIDSAKCSIILPKNARSLSSKCYSGGQGAKAEDCNIVTELIGDSVIITFKTNKSLLPNQGLTAATSWQKGIIPAPTFSSQAGYFIWNNKAVFFLPIAALFCALFCFVCWYRFGRDPEAASTVASFKPPAGYSPAALGYIYRQKFDRQLTAATIVDAAVRNIIKVEVEKEGMIFKSNTYKIGRPAKSVIKASSGYEDFRDDVEDLAGSEIKKGKYNSALGDLNTKVQKICEDSYKTADGSKGKKSSGFFALNNSFTCFPALVCVGLGIWAFFDGLVMAIKLKNFWQVGMFAGGIFLCWLVLKIFSKLLPAYNQKGRAVMDEIEGFRMYISATDADRFNDQNPPEKTLALYQKYLPFAIALGCENAWGKQFEDIIETAYLNPAYASSFSHSFTKDSSDISSSFASSFSGAISSASSPPSSSSGGGSSFGGGSSGGGGGGGGGGGW